MVFLTWIFDSKAKIHLTVLICLCWFNLTCQFQVFPQTFEGQYPYYQGPPGPPGQQGPTEPYLTQAPYQGSYYSGPPSATVPWEGLKTYGDTTKQPGRYLPILTLVLDVVLSWFWVFDDFFFVLGLLTVFMMEQNRDGDSSGGGRIQSFLSACSATLCCCCLWNLLGQCFWVFWLLWGKGNRNIKHLLISTAKTTSQLSWSPEKHTWKNTTICWFKRNVFSKARFISCVYMYNLNDCLWHRNNL